jgi:hypothetical protein
MGYTEPISPTGVEEGETPILTADTANITEKTFLYTFDQQVSSVHDPTVQDRVGWGGQSGLVKICIEAPGHRSLVDQTPISTVQYIQNKLYQPKVYFLGLINGTLRILVKCKEYCEMFKTGKGRR